MEIKELGHIVLWVRDLEASRHFYRDVLGFHEVETPSQSRASRIAFAGPTGRTHHELYLIEVGPLAAPLPPGRRVGMYHFGLKIGETDAELRQALQELVAREVPIVGGTDHGVTHSLYIQDPDGNEIELYIDVQPELWREDPSAFYAPAAPLRI